MIKEQTTTVDSSMINKYVYNFHTKTLKVEFSGGSLYEYSNVDPELYDEFIEDWLKRPEYTGYIQRELRGRIRE